MSVYCSFAVAVTLAVIITHGAAQSNNPYRSPYKCPSSQVPTNNCSTCAQDELCCNSVCATAVLPPRPCNAVSKASPFLVGAYVPQCSADGNFNPVQYWGSTGSSWCVDTSNGKPLSEVVAPRGQQPNCTVCTVSGKKYYPGQSFAAEDGCNTCVCSSTGQALCTLKACVTITIPYRSPYGCPFPKLLVNNCSTCAQDELCCNSMCTKAVLPPRPCDAAVASSYPSPLGAYVPQCSIDGNFNLVQYWGSTGSSWCVNTSNGKALSTVLAPRGQQPNCTTCTVSGKKYYPGQSFAAADGCNTCSCSAKGTAVCTVKNCRVRPSTPTYRSPYQCPPSQVATNNCSTCAQDELCCNSVCTTAVLPPRPCKWTYSLLLIGAYVPQCSADGNFNPVQVWGSTGYSWCVNTANGKPISEAFPRGQQPNCTVCAVSGKKYYPGQSFTAEDGCNTCICSNNGLAGCTKKACIACPVSGQVFTECGSACNATCDKPVSFCVLSCEAKCECPAGQVVDTKNNKCVEELDCPKPAPTASYISPYQCPTQTRATKNNCTSSCSADELCCNSACTKGVLSAKPCTVVASQSSWLLGAYVPQCRSDGTFEPIQSLGSTGYSWCVDISNGKPLSIPVGPRRNPNCTVCTVNGKTYYPGQSYADSCNTCSCTRTGASVCTKRACVECPAQGQTYTTCASSCDATCANPAPICTAHCVAKCQCPAGTVLDTSSNKCVSPKSCPKKGG